jgi:hypothetical protein
MAIAVVLPSHFVTVAIGNLDPIPNAGGTECDPGEGEVDKCMRVSHLRSATPTESPSIRRIPLTPASRAARRPPVSQAAGSSDANDSPSPIRVGPPTTENPFAGHKRCHLGPFATRGPFVPGSDSAARGRAANLSSVPKDDPGLNISPRFPCLPSL